MKKKKKNKGDSTLKDKIKKGSNSALENEFAAYKESKRCYSNAHYQKKKKAFALIVCCLVSRLAVVAVVVVPMLVCDELLCSCSCC